MTELKSYAVWDAGTRAFHWINAGCVLTLAAIGIVILFAGDLGITNDGKVLLKTVHVLTGYVLALNLLFRIAWGFLGNRHARWGAVLPVGRGYLRSLCEHLSALRRGVPQPYLGHNPLGRIAVAVLLLLLGVQAVTGLVLAGTDLFYPPFGAWIAQQVAAPGVAPASLVPYAPELVDAAAWESLRAWRKPFVLVHEYGFYVLAVAVVVHVAAVVITDLREGSALVSAMFTGRKHLRAPPLDGEDGPQG